MPTVLIGPPMLHHQAGPYRDLLEQAGFNVRYPEPAGKQMTAAVLAEHLPVVDAVLAGGEPYTPAIISSTTTLQIISRVGVGYDGVNIEAATAKNIPVAYTPGANHLAAAEHTLMLLLGLCKQVIDNHQMIASGRFVRRTMQPLRGKTLGIVGLGRIGKRVAKLAQAFGMNVIATDPYVSPDTIPPDLAVLVDRDTLLASADLVTVHTPLTSETKGYFNEATIARMKAGAFLVNTARGGIIVEADLAAALHEGHLAGAAIDVFEHEPPADDHPLRTAPNVIFSPHIAGIDTAALERMATTAAENLLALVRGEWPVENLVNGNELAGQWSWQNR